MKTLLHNQFCKIHRCDYSLNKEVYHITPISGDTYLFDKRFDRWMFLFCDGKLTHRKDFYDKAPYGSSIPFILKRNDFCYFKYNWREFCDEN